MDIIIEENGQLREIAVSGEILGWDYHFSQRKTPRNLFKQPFIAFV